MRRLVLACLLATLVVPGTASAADCRTKPSRKYDVRTSGSDSFKMQTPDGLYEHSHSWSAKFKRARTEITRCDGRIEAVRVSGDGRIKVSVKYREPDIVREPEPCDSDFICPRQTTTEPGCRFRHSGTYKADVHLLAHFPPRPTIVLGTGPRDERLPRDERAAQRDACGDTFKFVHFGARRSQADGLEWQVGDYFMGATAEAVVDLARRLARGEGASTGATLETRRETNDDGTIVETATAEGGITFGAGSPLRNRFPDGF